MLSQLTFFPADSSNQFTFPQVPTAPRASATPLRFDWNVSSHSQTVVNVYSNHMNHTNDSSGSCFFINSFKNLKM